MSFIPRVVYWTCSLSSRWPIRYLFLLRWGNIFAPLLLLVLPLYFLIPVGYLLLDIVLYNKKVAKYIFIFSSFFIFRITPNMRQFIGTNGLADLFAQQILRLFLSLLIDITLSQWGITQAVLHFRWFIIIIVLNGKTLIGHELLMLA